MNDSGKDKQQFDSIDLPADDNLMDLVDELTQDDDGTDMDDIVDLEDEIGDMGSIDDEDIIELEDEIVEEGDDILDLDEEVGEDISAEIGGGDSDDDALLELTEEAEDEPLSLEDEILDLEEEMAAEALEEEDDEDVLDLSEEVLDDVNDAVLDLEDEAAAVSDSEEYDIFDLEASAEEADDSGILDLEDDVLTLDEAIEPREDVLETDENGDVVLDLESDFLEENGGVGDSIDDIINDTPESLIIPGDEVMEDDSDVIDMAVAAETESESIPEGLNITEAQLDAALERVIKKAFGEKIDRLIESAVNETVITELKKLEETLLGKGD